MAQSVNPVSYFLFFLSALNLVTAAWNNLTLSDYKFKQSGYSTAIANLDTSLLIASMGTIMSDLNHDNPGTTPNVKNLVASSAYGWEESSDFDDQNTQKWYPQGVTTSADAYDKGTYEGYRVQLVSWHSDSYDSGKRGARISFVQQSSSRTKHYRHVLLVQPNGDSDFHAIPKLHAGGIMWYGTMLYVVDTWFGLRVFDLEHIYQVDDSIQDGIGKQTNGKFGAYGYKYVLPQVRTYAWQPKAGVPDLRHSWISLDRTTTPDSILVGEYNETCTNPGCRVIRWNIDYTTRLLVNSGGIATASEAVSHGNGKIQGGTTINGKFFLAQSTEGRLITWTWTGGKNPNDNTFPHNPEDLSYEKGVGLWTLMETPGSRSVFAVDPSKF